MAEPVKVASQTDPRGISEVAEAIDRPEPELLRELGMENRQCNAGDQYSCCVEETLANELWRREEARLIARDAQ